MRDGGGDERPRAGGEPAAAVEIILRRGQSEQVVNVEYKPEKRASQLHHAIVITFVRHLLEQFSDEKFRVEEAKC